MSDDLKPDYIEVPEPKPDPCHCIPRWRYLELWAELADGSVTRASLARKYGVSRAAITLFAKRHRGRIEEVRSKLDQEFAGLWIADKRRRVEALQMEYEASASCGEYALHYEHIRTRMQILRAVADELGQIPQKSTITIGGTVRHELVGVPLDECFPVVPDDAASLLS